MIARVQLGLEVARTPLYKQLLARESGAVLLTLSPREAGDQAATISPGHDRGQLPAPDCVVFGLDAEALHTPPG